mmetsp:Transcript_34907/g.73643  ORF Transcript_34907/g.73643 Transcript_34907/m.73643 type:complete len:585 (-) Transcript_34907:1312-3066(-)
MHGDEARPPLRHHFELHHGTPVTSNTKKITTMSGEGQQTVKGDADGNVASPRMLDSKKNESTKNEQGSPSAVYWSVLHHKNLHEGGAVGQHMAGQPVVLPKDTGHFRERTEQLPDQSDVPTVIHERQALIGDSTRSTLTFAGYGSEPVSPQLPTSPVALQQPHSSGSESKWSVLREAIDSKDLFIRYHSEAEEGGKSGPSKSKKWSDVVNIQYEFTRRECLIIFIALLTIGTLPYSFIFEDWSIIDSLYFTTILLTTVGYGDVTPVTPGGKLFASVFALGGIVILGIVLGIVGSQLVEAEIKYTEKVKSKTTRALERAFAKRSRHHHHRKVEIENIANSFRMENKTLSRSCSASSLDTSTGSVSTESSANSLSSKSERHPSEPPRNSAILSVIKRHWPGFAWMLVGGFVMALLEDWGWHDAVYYCVVTATTIGFGDLAPEATLTKCYAIIFVPLAVAAMGYILGNVASFIVDRRRAEYTKRLWSGEMKLEDLEALDEGHDGGVDELEYIKFMLVAMNKVDGDLFDNLRHNFQQLDVTNSGQITKRDLKIMVTRKMKKVSNKLNLYRYKVCSCLDSFNGVVSSIN